MPVHLSENPYSGVNAHFNSLLQNTHGGWLTFHSDHITHLKSYLNRILPQGYYAVTEQSLQIQISSEPRSRTRPDVVVLHRDGTPSNHAAQSSITPTLELASHDLIEDEDELTAVIIYQSPDQPITRFELLSPSNKTSDRRHYMAMRHKTLEAGLNLVEIDYLHQTPPLFPNVLADYSHHEENAYPYMILVTDPTPTADQESGITQFYCFHIDDPIPTLAVPLLNNEAVLVDFGAVYNITFADDRRAQLLIDYEQEPENLKAYPKQDQAKIESIMSRLIDENLD